MRKIPRTSDSGRQSFAPRAKPPPTPRVPKAPTEKRTNDDTLVSEEIRLITEYIIKLKLKHNS